LCGVVDESLQIFDGAVDEDTRGVMAGCVPWEKGIRASCQDEDIIWDCLPRGAGDKFVLGVDFGDFCVEVVIQGAWRAGRILWFH
jgi:hypothetical protein